MSDNETRSGHARVAMDAYCQRLNGGPWNFDEDDVTDLLTDLMHMLHMQTGIDFDTQLRMARENFTHEQEETE